MAGAALRYFFFTDIEGSTPLWERFPTAMQGALARHDTLLHQAIQSQGGEVFKTVGDAFFAVFTSPETALHAAVAAQHALTQESWGEIGTLKVRMALYGGEVEERGGDYFGMPLNRVARLLDAGHGGQILVPASLQEKLSDAPVSWLDRGFQRLRGISEPEHIFQVVAQGLPEVFPPLRTESAHRHNLPSEITSFVGRRGDVLALRRLLVDQKARLVTVTGLGGGGKSRLALHIASDLLWRYPEGIWYVDVVSLSRPEEFATTLLHACGLTEDPGKTTLQQLSAHFRSAATLILIDGAERFEELADEIALLLKSTEQLQVLATSRSLLYLSMEHEYPLSPLSQAESLELFVERTRQARPDFACTAENQATLEALCDQLEGTPLAVELAAAQTRSLTLSEIQSALQERFTVLSSRMRDLHPRHRSLRATIDWSYQTLSDDERRLFQGISCFTGSFSIEAAQKVCGILCTPAGIPDLLIALRDKSLLRLELESGRYLLQESGRYLLQESLRAFGAEALEQEGIDQQALLRARHGTYFQELVTRQAPELRGTQQREALTTLEHDAANIREAQEHFLIQGRLQEAARIAIGLGRFWEIRGWLREGRERLQRLLQQQTLADPLTRAELLLTAGRLAWNSASADQAVRHLERCIALCQELGAVAAQPERTARTVLGMIAYSRGELAAADTHYEAALAIPLEGDAAGTAALQANLGINALARGAFARALSLFEETLAFRQAIGDTVREAHAWNCIGAAAAGLERLVQAAAAFSQSQTLYQSLGDPVHAAHARLNRGDIALRQGDPEHALQFYDAALAPLRETEDWRGIVVCYLGQAKAALAQERLSPAASALHEALRLSHHYRYQENLASALELTALLAQEQGDTPFGERVGRAANTLREQLQSDTAPPTESADAPIIAEVLAWLEQNQV
ncbi:tetratricopeptide repeat protein [Armatimonas sp.]|uniref:tetratricopeptide repeat protein n=1 Tax=Armatimonas sp. TaxID=1872638 RepID=UPI00286C678E|nr:tetratricopeptide repeat protein [Armatimonas sp.]